ncbi:MAG TPA: hypothetical protein VNE16_08565 [Vicinamibacterales bacterium]|nr:hypothetical protein [Vicinamibacterales bacterium]
MVMERVICVPLNDAEWQAFLAVQPQPVAWLQQQIRQQVQAAAASEQAKTAQPRSVAVN